MPETQPKCFVFVLMPFAQEFLDVYEVGIKAACREAGAYCERVDETFFDEGILARIYNQISKADVIVGLMTGRSPNVFYEVGYAHALGKRVILLTSTAEDIPFDLKHHPCIVYGGRIAELKNQLQRRIEWCIAHPADSLARADVQVRILVAGTEVVADRVVDVLRCDWNTRLVELTFSIHNPTSLMYVKGSFQVGVVTPEAFRSCSSTKEEEAPSQVEHRFIPGQGHVPVVVPQTQYPKGESFPLADGRMLHLLTWWSSVIFPSGWTSVSCRLKQESEITPGEVHEFSVRLFTELGAKDFPFKVKIV